MKVLFYKGPRGIELRGNVPDDYAPGAGEFVKPLDDFALDEMPAAWAERRVWPQGEGAPRLPTASESLEALRAAKQAELELAFDAVASANLGPRPYLGLMIYLELPNDPRTVAVKAARQNFNNKTQALSDLGRPGRPALTEANIAAVVW